jgi:carboxymethylenebutenolidase
MFLQILRHLVASAAASLLAVLTAHAADKERRNDHADSAVELRCRGDLGRPLIVLLHGLGGYERFAASYDAYADLLARVGWRVCAALYYSGDDQRIMTTSDQATRDAYRERRFERWVNAVVKEIDELSSGQRVGLLGFSQGGYLAVAVAGKQPRVRALAELYGGIPRWGSPQIDTLPPTLIVHGEADTVVPIAEGEALAAFASKRSDEVVMQRYAGAEHGFDFDWEALQSVDVRRRITAFFERQLGNRVVAR